VKHFSINGSHYLITANNDKRTDYRGTSSIYVLNTLTKLFEKFQTLHTSFAYDATFFTIKGSHYLAILNHSKGITTRLHSVIYKWNRKTFDPCQYIETLGATDLEYINFGERHFLAIANSYDSNNNNYHVKSKVYLYDDNLDMFVNYQSIPTTSAQDLEFFTLGRDLFLVCASSSDSKKELDNVVYRYQGVEGFVPVHRIKTPPSSDWTKFESRDNRHFLISSSLSSSDRESKIFELITF